ncbi:hypothetical protein AWZ03_006219 [Drosophila navojoa]|uniref:Uncharacterized protein n=1 Tax=Drosophila navojoa TaxID=7232 RepID=A0A484BH52_DRONA|nr:hypothetical protein AWZ03_006219 [Drosophila navojoa]
MNNWTKRTQKWALPETEWKMSELCANANCSKPPPPPPPPTTPSQLRQSLREDAFQVAHMLHKLTLEQQQQQEQQQHHQQEQKLDTRQKKTSQRAQSKTN